MSNYDLLNQGLLLLELLDTQTLPVSKCVDPKIC